MSSARQTTFVRAEPQLLARSISESVEFYAKRLGFSVAFVYGEPPFYAQVYRGDAYLNIRHVDHPVLDARWVAVGRRDVQRARPRRQPDSVRRPGWDPSYDFFVKIGRRQMGQFFIFGSALYVTDTGPNVTVFF